MYYDILTNPALSLLFINFLMLHFFSISSIMTYLPSIVASILPRPCCRKTLSKLTN